MWQRQTRGVMSPESEAGGALFACKTAGGGRPEVEYRIKKSVLTHLSLNNVLNDPCWPMYSCMPLLRETLKDRRLLTI
jgi:hypothetical protein